MRPLPSIASVFVLAMLAPLHASAQEAHTRAPRRWSFGVELGAGTMIHDFEHAGVDLGTPAVNVLGRFHFRLFGPLSLQFGGTFGQFVRERRNVQLVAGAAGLAVRFPVGRRGHLWADADVGVFLPGTVVRPGFDVGLGYAFDIGANISLGPYLRLSHVWEGREGIGRFDLPYAPLPDQDTSSIQWWTAGVSVSFHTGARAPRPGRVRPSP